LRPVGPEPRVHVPRQPNVGDGKQPPADVRILKARGTDSGAVKTRTPGGSGQNQPTTVKLPSEFLHSSTVQKADAIPVAARELAAALRLPPDISSFAALSALIGEGLPLDARTAQVLRRIIHLHHDDPAAARIAARALAAGLDPEGAAVQKVLGVLDSPDSGGSGASGSDTSAAGGSSAGHDDSRGRHPDSGGLQPEAAATTADGDQIKILAASLKAAAQSALKDPDLRDLAARNADGSGWVCIPFDIPLAGINFHGFFRILYYGMMGPAIKLVADIRCGGERRLLELTGSGNAATIAYHADDERERVAFRTEFDAMCGVSTSTLAEADFAELSSRRSVDEDA